MIGATFLNGAREHAWITGIVVGVLIGVLTSMSVQTWADFTSDDVPRLIPYQGVLEYNGQPWDALPEDVVNPNPTVRFQIYRGSALTDLTTCEEHNVQVHNGRFTVLLGEGTPCQGHQPIGEVVREAEDLHLKMTIVNPFPGSEDEVELSNAQRLLPAPFSLWTANATNLKVRESLNISHKNSPIENGPNLAVTNTVVGGPRIVVSDLSNPDGDLSLRIGRAFPNRGNVEVTVDGDLSVVDDANFEGAVTMGSAEVTGGASVSGGLTVVTENVEIDDGKVVVKGGNELSEYGVSVPVDEEGYLTSRTNLPDLSFDSGYEEEVFLGGQVPIIVDNDATYTSNHLVDGDQQLISKCTNLADGEMHIFGAKTAPLRTRQVSLCYCYSMGFNNSARVGLRPGTEFQNLPLEVCNSVGGRLDGEKCLVDYMVRCLDTL